MSFSRSLGARLFLAFSLLACAFAQSPSKPPADDSVPTFKASTHVVLLDVVATDNQGHPVTDLKRDEITIVEQGKPQKLASFALVDSKKPFTPVDPIRALSPGVYYNGPEVEAAKGPITVLLLDALNTSFADQKYGRYQMLKYLDEHRGQRMAVFGLTDALILLQNFTDDPEVLHKVIDRKGVRQTSLHPEEGGDAASGVPDILPLGLDKADLNHFFEEFAIVQANNRTKITVEALKAISRWLSGYPGRKKLIWVAGSFPVQLDPGELGRFTYANPYIEEVKEAATLLTDSRISVYPIDAGGLTGFGSSTSYSTAQSGRDVNGRAPTGPQMGSAISTASGAIAAGHANMNAFAQQTGGRAFYNGNDLAMALEQSLADGSIYYTLSYSPADKNWDGNLRRLQVKTSRPGLQLRYRGGYYALNPLRAAAQKPAQVDKEIKSALVSPLLASGISFYGSAQPTLSQAGSNPQMRPTEVRFLVDTKNILFEAVDGDLQHCNLKFFVGVYADNKLVSHIEQTMDGNLKPETFASMAKTGMLFHTQVNVPDEKVRLRLIVRDNRSGKIGALDIPYSNEVAAK
jgi:VWFA-related protein